MMQQHSTEQRSTVDSKWNIFVMYT